MSEIKRVALIGTFSEEEIEILKRITKKIWDTSLHLDISGGSKNALEIIPLMGMSAVILSTNGLLKPPPFKPEDFPSFKKMRETKGCRIGVLLGDGEMSGEFFSSENLPDFVINILGGEGVLRTL